MSFAGIICSFDVINAITVKLSSHGELCLMVE